MNEYFNSFILQKTGASSLVDREIIQPLWSGYGNIQRIGLANSVFPSVVVKHIVSPVIPRHPRAWSTDDGHLRKLKSYQVETFWYQKYSAKSIARLPKCIGITKHNEEVLIILEDLNQAGYSRRKSSVSWKEIKSCLAWLAQFHASFIGAIPKDLWKIGTYWHLETRPDELAVLSDNKLKDAAAAIDAKLSSCQFKTFVHGDAKLANFCFSDDGRVAGVDFQYVGGGCGMKDVAYFIGSCLGEQDCESMETEILDVYFEYLQQNFSGRNQELEREWRPLYRVAWADFHRFLKGWSPGHWKINSYSERVTSEVIENL